MGAWRLLSFIALIAWCRWRGTPEDQGEASDAEEENAIGDARHDLPKGRMIDLRRQ